ncbi:MAG: hypothetical protein J6Q53_04805 [Oscillospiraceae bacterium]|nr:hypothetical protein [Oscillospiraceae bacterium]
MKTIKTTNITLANGSAAILSTSEIHPGEYETMLASPDFGTEYKVMRAWSEESALDDHKWLKKQYHVAPLSGKYLQLSKDLAEAARKAEVIATILEDSGTCNFDSCTLYLKGWNQSKVEQAARAAGVGCFVWNLWGSKSFVFPLRIAAQGDPNTVAAEAMRDCLTGKGYSAGMYYQMD